MPYLICFWDLPGLVSYVFSAIPISFNSQNFYLLVYNTCIYIQQYEVRVHALTQCRGRQTRQWWCCRCRHTHNNLELMHAATVKVDSELRIAMSAIPGTAVGPVPAYATPSLPRGGSRGYATSFSPVRSCQFLSSAHSGPPPLSWSYLQAIARAVFCLATHRAYRLDGLKTVGTELKLSGPSWSRPDRFKAVWPVLKPSDGFKTVQVANWSLPKGKSLPLNRSCTCTCTYIYNVYICTLII